MNHVQNIAGSEIAEGFEKKTVKGKLTKHLFCKNYLPLSNYKAKNRLNNEFTKPILCSNSNDKERSKRDCNVINQDHFLLQGSLGQNWIILGVWDILFILFHFDMGME